MQKKKQIAVLGYGVVGSGVVELFYQNQEKIEKILVIRWTLSTFWIFVHLKAIHMQIRLSMTSMLSCKTQKSAMLQNAWAVSIQHLNLSAAV